MKVLHKEIKNQKTNMKVLHKEIKDQKHKMKVVQEPNVQNCTK
jgi:hypothetical protein